MKMNPLWMILGCALPLLLVPILTRFGIKSGIAMLLMMACHLFMPGRRHDEKRRDALPGEPSPAPTPTNKPKS